MHGRGVGPLAQLLEKTMIRAAFRFLELGRGKLPRACALIDAVRASSCSLVELVLEIVPLQGFMGDPAAGHCMAHQQVTASGRGPPRDDEPRNSSEESGGEHDRTAQEKVCFAHDCPEKFRQASRPALSQVKRDADPP